MPSAKSGITTTPANSQQATHPSRLQRALSRREEFVTSPHLFPGGLSPAETVLRESSRFNAQNRTTDRFPRVEIKRMAFVKVSRSENACPDSCLGLVQPLSDLQHNSLCDSYLQRTKRRKSYLSLIPSQTASFVSRVYVQVTFSEEAFPR